MNDFDGFLFLVRGLQKNVFVVFFSFRNGLMIFIFMACF